jgi:hypothetical protein
MAVRGVSWSESVNLNVRTGDHTIERWRNGLKRRKNMFQRGLRELIASNTCVRQFSGFGIGERRSLPGGDWTIVGHFDQGVGEQCTVYADVDIVMSTFSRNAYSIVSVLLRWPSDYDAFRAAVQANPTLHLEAKHEKEVVQGAFKQLNGLLDFVSYFVGTIMALGATLGAVNSLYSIVDARRRELARSTRTSPLLRPVRSSLSPSPQARSPVTVPRSSTTIRYSACSGPPPPAARSDTPHDRAPAKGPGPFLSRPNSIASATFKFDRTFILTE